MKGEYSYPWWTMFVAVAIMVGVFFTIAYLFDGPRARDFGACDAKCAPHALAEIVRGRCICDMTREVR